MTIRDKLIESGLFKETESRDLIVEVERTVQRFDAAVDQYLRVTLSFDQFGDITGINAIEYDGAMRKMVAQNRQAMGLPPQRD